MKVVGRRDQGRGDPASRPQTSLPWIRQWAVVPAGQYTSTSVLGRIICQSRYPTNIVRYRPAPRAGLRPPRFHMLECFLAGVDASHRHARAMTKTQGPQHFFLSRRQFKVWFSHVNFASSAADGDGDSKSNRRSCASDVPQRCCATCPSTGPGHHGN